MAIRRRPSASSDTAPSRSLPEREVLHLTCAQHGVAGEEHPKLLASFSLSPRSPFLALSSLCATVEERAVRRITKLRIGAFAGAATPLPKETPHHKSRIVSANPAMLV